MKCMCTASLLSNHGLSEAHVTRFLRIAHILLLAVECIDKVNDLRRNW